MSASTRSSSLSNASSSVQNVWNVFITRKSTGDIYPVCNQRGAVRPTEVCIPTSPCLENHHSLQRLLDDHQAGFAPKGEGRATISGKRPGLAQSAHAPCFPPVAVCWSLLSLSLFLSSFVLFTFSVVMAPLVRAVALRREDATTSSGGEYRLLPLVALGEADELDRIACSVPAPLLHCR